MEDIWIVIPAFNESKHISNVIKDVKNECFNNIVVVDDGSRDNTYDIACSFKGINVIKHPRNLGKGAALRTGCDFAIKKGAKKIIVIDSDGQHDPKKIPEFLNNLEDNDIVFGYRKFSGSMPLRFRIGNVLIDNIQKLLFKTKVKDTQCGYRAFTSKTYNRIKWRSKDYSVESEVVARVGKYKLKYKQIPIATIYPEKNKGTTILDGIKIVLKMFSWRFE